MSKEMREHINTFKKFLLKENVLVKIGDFILTKDDLDSKYKDKITKHFGEYNEDTINNSLWTLYDIENLYNNGGYIYRVIWLKNEKDFNINNLGNHWLSNKSDIDNIISLFTLRDNVKGHPYYIKAYTPPKNVSIPYDYFNNIEENEVLVINDKLLSKIELIKY
jgi:hypothetical protein